MKFFKYTPTPRRPEKVLAIRLRIDSSRGHDSRWISEHRGTRGPGGGDSGHPSETHGVARRANAVLLLDDGLSCVEVAKGLYLDDDTVRTWLKRYRAGGLDEMTLFDWHGRSGHLSREQEAELSAHLSQRLYRDTGEVAAHIKATYGVIYSHSGCIKVMHRLGFEYKRPKSLPAQGR